MSRFETCASGVKLKGSLACRLRRCAPPGAVFLAPIPPAISIHFSFTQWTALLFLVKDAAPERKLVVFLIYHSGLQVGKNWTLIPH